MNKAIVIGAGLAGSEAAWQLARRGVDVTLIEMRPNHASPAHHTGQFAELVCSNSLRGAALSTAPGLLKEELRRTGSLIMQCADQCAVPAGGALAVDRERFSQMVTERLCAHPRVTVVHERVDDIPPGSVIVASGPLTEGALADSISRALGQSEPLHFYDAAAPLSLFPALTWTRPILRRATIKGTLTISTVPWIKSSTLLLSPRCGRRKKRRFTALRTKRFLRAVCRSRSWRAAEKIHCRYGPMKPVGLRDPRTGARPYAVVQLRADNAQKTMYNVVGFQTHLRFPEQKRVFSMIPGLENAEFLRYGVMHRNSFLRSPGLLDRYYRVIGRENLWFAGQITGVEGYIESAASGLCAGLNLARQLQGRALIDFPPETALGALALHISTENRDFQPMNINFGLLPPMPERIRGKRERYTALAMRALGCLEQLRPVYQEDLEYENHH